MHVQNVFTGQLDGQVAKGSKQANMNRHIECCIESIEVHIKFHEARGTC